MPIQTATERLADSALIKLVAPFVSVLILTVGTWLFGRLNERLDRFDAFLQQAQTTQATTDFRLKALETNDVTLTASEKLIADKVLIHEFQIQELQRGPGQKK